MTRKNNIEMLVFLFNFSDTLSIYKTGGATGISLSDKKDHLVDQCDLTGTERFTNLFER